MPVHARLTGHTALGPPQAPVADALPGSGSAAPLPPMADGRGCHDGLMFGAPQVNFYVEDIEAAADFYRGLLGFTEAFRTPQKGAPTYVELRLDGFTLGLATIESLREVHGVTAGTGPPRAEVVVWTDDVDAAFAELSANGVRVLSPPHDFLASLRAAWIADPEGNPVQVRTGRDNCRGANDANIAVPERRRAAGSASAISRGPAFPEQSAEIGRQLVPDRDRRRDVYRHVRRRRGLRPDSSDVAFARTDRPCPLCVIG